MRSPPFMLAVPVVAILLYLIAWIFDVVFLGAD